MGHEKYPEMVTYRHVSSRGSCCSDVGASVGCTSHGRLDGNEKSCSGVECRCIRVPRSAVRQPEEQLAAGLVASAHLCAQLLTYIQYRMLWCLRRPLLGCNLPSNRTLL